MAKTYSVNFNTPALTVSGEAIKDEKGDEAPIGKFLADHIAGAAGEKNVVKLYGWAQAMFKGDTIKLDSEDHITLKQFVELLPRMPIGLKAQCLEILNEAKAAE